MGKRGFLLASHIFDPEDGLISLHSIRSQKVLYFIVTAVRIWNPKKINTIQTYSTTHILYYYKILLL
jgi:hypothetical protein